MPQLSVCIYTDGDEGMHVWMDLRGVHGSPEQLGRFVQQEFANITILTTFAIQSSEIETKHQPLFHALAAMEQGMADSKTPLSDHLPTHLLEELVEKIIERGQLAIKKE